MNFFIDARKSSNIGIMNNDFTNVAEIVKLGEGMTKEDLFLSSNMK